MKRLLSISLTVILLISSSGIMFSTHYCFGMKVKSGFTQSKNTIGCFMTSMDKGSTKSCDFQDKIQNKSCCDNTYDSIHTDSDFSGSDVQLDLSQKVFLTLFVFTFTNPYSLDSKSTLSFNDNSPPPLVNSDYQAFYQTYLI